MRVHKVSIEEQRLTALQALQALPVPYTPEELERLEIEIELEEALTDVGVSDVSKAFGVSATAVRQRLLGLCQSIAVISETVFSPGFGKGGQFIRRRVTRLTRVQVELAEVMAGEARWNSQHRNGKCRTVKT